MRCASERQVIALLMKAARLGAPCPGNTAMAAQLGCAQPTVKGAVKRLSLAGLVEIENKGAAYRRVRVRMDAQAAWSPWSGWSAVPKPAVVKALAGIPKGEADEDRFVLKAARRHFAKLNAYAMAAEVSVQALYS